MKKVLRVCCAFILMSGLLTGCSYFELPEGKVYFYGELAGNDNDDSNRSLDARDEGYVIVMSRGIVNKNLTRSEAEALLGVTEFSLSLDGVNKSPLGDLSVDQLGTTGYHVVQEFDIGPLNPGDYVLKGVTELKDEGTRRSNTVYLNAEWTFLNWITK